MDDSGTAGPISLHREAKRHCRQERVRNKTPTCRSRAFAGLVVNAVVRFVFPFLFFVPFLSAQQPSTPLTLDAALAYARQNSPKLLAQRQGVTAEQAAIAGAKAERLPRLTLAGAARVSSQATETAMGFPLPQLADIPEDQPLRKGHLDGDIRATLPLYSGGRIGSAVGLAQAQRDLAQVGVHDLERSLDFEVTSAYANLVQLDRDIEAARESVNALTEGRRVVAQMLNEGKVARDLLKIDTRLADVQDTAIEFKNAREIEAGRFNALLGSAIDTPVTVETTLPRSSSEFSLDQVAQLAHTGNSQYQIAKAQVSIAERSVAVARAAQRPSLSLAADLRGQSVDPFGVYKSGVAAGVVFNFPFFDRTLTHRVEEPESRELDAEQRARSAYLQVQNSEERIRATETAISSARESLRIEQEKLRYGRGIIENLLDAQAALLTSEAPDYRALADHTTAAVRRETGL
jgi:outer membrane protein TolC